jgi:hypothetical protein
VLLPLHFNDGREVPAEWLADAVLEIVDRFGAASYETQILKLKLIDLNIEMSLNHLL